MNNSARFLLNFRCGYQLVFALAFLLGLVACKPSIKQRTGDVVATEEIKMNEEIIINLGEKGTDFSKRHRALVRVVHQPAGVDFYELNWPVAPRGKVKFDVGRSSFGISNVLSVSTSQDLGPLKDEGFNEIDINAGITAPELISHDEARLKFYEVLKALKAKGWTQRYYHDDPRISGRFRLDHILGVSDSIGLDCDYVPSIQEWMRIPSRTACMLYAAGVFLDVSFTREPSLIDPTKPGAYLLTYNLKTDTEYFRGFAGPDDRLRWKEVLKPELAKAAASRAEKEAALRAKGVPIDESYQDPPLPAGLR
ncbi:MAG: hypothetical protein ACK5O3_07355 [Burkholderiales bacterium]|jgi:hypothetical protein